MPSYHVNDRGNPGICRATIQRPFGGEEEHFSSPPEAREHFEATQGAVFTRMPHTRSRSSQGGSAGFGMLGFARLVALAMFGKNARIFFSAFDHAYAGGMKAKNQELRRETAELKQEIQYLQTERARALLLDLDRDLATEQGAGDGGGEPPRKSAPVKPPAQPRAVAHFEKLAKDGQLHDEALAAWANRDNAEKIDLLRKVSKIRDVRIEDLADEQVVLATRLTAAGLISRSPKNGGSWVLTGSDETPADDAAVKASIVQLKKTDRTALFAAVGTDGETVTEENLPAVLQKAADLRDVAARP